MTDSNLPLTASRRAFLEGLGTAAAGASLLSLASGCPAAPPGDDDDATSGTRPDVAPLRSPEPPPWEPGGTLDAGLFPLGVQSGDPTVDAAVVWGRYDGTEALTLRVARADGATAWLDELQEAMTPDEAGVVKLNLTGLLPDTAYAFVFIDASDARSLVGRFRTAPNDDSWRIVRFGATSCTAQGYRPFPCLSHTAPEALDFFLSLGDTTYCDGNQTTEQYRESWSENFSAQGYLDLRASTSLLMTWDDHEVENVNGGEWDVTAARMAIARTEFWRHNTVRPDPANEFRLWRTLRFGRAVEVFVLDCRGERVLDEDRYISEAQMDWLKAALSASTAAFKIVMNSVPIGNLVAGQSLDSAFDASPFILDRWEGYPLQRAEILDHIVDNGIDRVIWVSGDVHFGAFLELEIEGPYQGQWDVVAGPGGNNNPLASALEQAPPFTFVTGENNWVLFEADPVAGTLRAAFVSDTGDELFSQVFTSVALADVT